MNRKTYSNKVAKLSGTARKTLTLIEQGRFYKVEYPPAMRPVITELVNAGLIRRAARVVVIEANYVPSVGYKPYKPEVFSK